jgi:poly(3-hydroxybutyrate) depolymerase
VRRTGVILMVVCGLLVAACGEQQEPAPPPAVDHELTLQVGAKQRTYLLHTPPGLPADRPVPLVIGLHFYPGSADKMREMTAMDAKADQHGFLTAYPQGTDGGFNALVCCGEEDDVAFLKTLTQELIAKRRADPDRVYLAGISNGGDMSFRAAVEATGLFAAIGVVSGGFIGPLTDPAGYRPRRPVSVVTILGTLDMYYDSFKTGLATWQKRLKCVPGATPPAPAPGVERASARCADGSDLETYVVKDMGHLWPGAKTGQLADPNAPIMATDIVWDFFATHPRR